MKFSLRFILLASILVGTGLGLYFLELEKRKPVTLQIDYRVPMENEIERPATLTEFRSRVNVREVDKASRRYEKHRITEILNDFSCFDSRSWYAEGVVEEHPDVMRDAAEVALEHDDFQAVVSAAWTLEKLGDNSALEKLQQRCLEGRDSDQKAWWRAFEVLGEGEATLSREIIEWAREIARSDSKSAIAAALMLVRKNIDDEALLPFLSQGVVNDDNLNWLLRNRPSKDVRSAVKNHLLSDKNVSYGSQELYSTIFETGQSNPEFKSMVEFAEVQLCDFLQGDNIDQMDREFAMSHLRKHATSLSVPFLESEISVFDTSEFYPEMITLLHRIGETESAKRHVLRLVDELSDEFDKWNGEYVKNGLMRISPQILGPEKTVELCIKYSSPIGMAEFVESTRDANAHKQLGCDRESLSGAREQAMEYLVKQKAKSDFAFSRFAKNWYHTGLSRQKVVDWINKNLKPTTSLTVDRVLSHERYPIGEGIWYTWSRFDHQVDDIHTFLLMGLAHSGHGHLAHWEYTHPEMVTDSIEEYAAIESNEFRVGAHDQVGSYPTNCSIVVNDRVYRFDVSEGPNGSDERFDVGVIADLMNTIAIRQRLERRLFIYEAEKGYCLVMLITPEMARELSLVFGIHPDRGTDHYLDH